MPGGTLMQPSDRTTTVSRGGLWMGRIFVALIFLFMLLDGGIKVLRNGASRGGNRSTGLSHKPRLADRRSRACLRLPLCNSAYVDSGGYLADRFSRRRDRYPGARPGRVVLLSRCDWHDSLGGTVLDGRTIARADPATKSEGGLLEGRVRDLA